MSRPRWMAPALCLALLADGAARAQEPTPGAETGEQGRAEQATEPLPLVEEPAIEEYVEAAYPEAAREQRIETTVMLLVELDAEGEVQSVQVVGPAEPPGLGFDQAAREAVEQMRFRPARTAEGPVPIAFELAYDFRLQPEPAAPSPINLDGQLRQKGPGDPVVGATVYVVGTQLETRSDEEGRFELRGLPPGTAQLRILAPGFVVLEREVVIVEGERTTANLWMRSESYRDNESVGLYRPEQEEVTRRVIGIEEVRRVPGTFGDPVRIIQTLPGAARSPFGTGFLVIRGSNPEDSGVYIDGVRIPIIYHLTGTTSVLSPDMIDSVEYLPGGYGVQYGRSMGGVVDIQTRSEIEESRLTWGTDILDTQLYFQGRVGKNKKHGLAVGARRSYVDAFIPLFAPGGWTISPRYWDYQIKWMPESHGDFSAFVYGFNDVLEVSTPSDVAQGSDQDTQGDLRTQYASQRLVLRWSPQLSEQLMLDLTPSLGVDYNNFGLGDEFRLDGTNLLLELRAELPWTPSEHVQLVPGLDFIGGYFGFDFESPFRFVDIQDPLAEREAVAYSGGGWLGGPDPYLKLKLRPLADPEAWLITPGIRGNIIAVTYGGDVTEGVDSPGYLLTAADPRISTRLRLARGNWLKAATGLYHQPPQPFEAIGLGTEANVGFERAWSSSIGYEQQLSQALEWDVDLFYKDLGRLIIFREEWTGFGEEIFANAGLGRAYGAELILRHAPVGRFFGWVSYTLSKSERQDAPGEEWYPFDFDQTHIFSAQGGYNLPADIGISAQVQYVTGNPTTPYDLGIYDVDGDFYNPFTVGGYNGDRLPPFFQTSLRVDKLFTFKRWQLETYVDLINAVRGVNPEFTIYNYDYTEFAYVRGLPFIPNIGVEAKFWP